MGQRPDCIGRFVPGGSPHRDECPSSGTFIPMEPPRGAATGSDGISSGENYLQACGKRKGLAVLDKPGQLSWSHRDAAHISEGHLLRYACSRTCDVHNVVHNAGMSCQEGMNHVIDNIVSLERGHADCCQSPYSRQLHSE